MVSRSLALVALVVVCCASCALSYKLPNLPASLVDCGKAMMCSAVLANALVASPAVCFADMGPDSSPSAGNVDVMSSTTIFEAARSCGRAGGRSSYRGGGGGFSRGGGGGGARYRGGGGTAIYMSPSPMMMSPFGYGYGGGGIGNFGLGYGLGSMMNNGGSSGRMYRQEDMLRQEQNDLDKTKQELELSKAREKEMEDRLEKLEKIS